MGIQGLIPFLKNSTRITNIRNFSGQTVAVDAYCWLHKGAFGCADKLALGKPTDFFVVYCIKRVNTLLSYGIKPVLVFDGQRLPSKAETEAKRRENRHKNLKNAKIFLQEGKTREARECFQRCVDVTPEMAHQLILACKEMGVDCVVAPYEADAQLAYLNLIGIAKIIITEDSDLILFGCERVFFKMDSEGNGVLFEKRELKRSFGAKAIHLTFEKFRYACILSGCDYLPSLPGIGLVKALKFFSLITNPDLKWALTKIPAYLKMPRLANQVTSDYVEGFIRANNTFLYQLVFCPLKKKLVPLNPYPPDLDTDTEALDYAGKYFDNDLALGIATARINYQTKKAFSSALTFGQNDGPPLYKPKFKFQSIWSQNYTPSSSVTSVSPPPPPISTSTEGKTMVIARVLAPKADVRPKKRPLRVQNENDGHFEMESEEIMKLYSSPGDGATKRRKMDPDSEQKPTTSEKINWTESSPPPKEALDDDSGIDASQETAATPKRNVFRVDNNESREKRTPRLVTSRFFPITPTTTRSGGGGSRNSSDSVETDEESTSSKKSSVFDEIDREGDSKTSLKRPDNGSTSSKKSSVFDEIDQDFGTETSRNIDKESTRSKERSPSPETRVETESRGQKPIFDKTQQQKLDEITTNMNKFAWKPKENGGVGGKVRATMASLSSFKPPQIVGKTVAQVVNDNEEEFRAKDIPVKKTKAPTPVTVKYHEKMLKGSCRTVGLSKKQKPRPSGAKPNSSSTTTTTTTRQLRLTDMLNNYRYQK